MKALDGRLLVPGAFLLFLILLDFVGGAMVDLRGGHGVKMLPPPKSLFSREAPLDTASPEPPEPLPEPVGTIVTPPIISVVPAPTSVQPSTTASPTALRDTPILPYIPGLTAEDLIQSLQSSGFACTSPAVQRSGLTWTCRGRSRSGVDYLVVIGGIGTETLRFVNATVSQPNDTASDVLAALFLGSLASLPYPGSQPERTRQWVVSQIASGGSLTVGTVYFELSGAKPVRVLDMIAAGGRSGR